MKPLAFALLLTGALVCSPHSVTALDGLEMHVSPSVSMAPANVNVRAHVAPDADNRGIEFSADSEDFFRKSFVTLEGDKAPAITQLAFTGLPGGEYQVSVSLIGSRGVRATVTRRVRILSSAMDR
jgi:hypothetical protein